MSLQQVLGVGKRPVDVAAVFVGEVGGGALAGRGGHSVSLHQASVSPGARRDRDALRARHLQRLIQLRVV